MLRLFALAGFAMTVLGVSPGTLQAQAQNATLYTVTYVEVGPVLAKVGAARAARLSRRRAQGRRQPRRLSAHRPAQPVRGARPPGPIAKAFESHTAGDTAKKLNEKLATMLAAPNDTRQHNALSVAPAKPGKDADRRGHPRRCDPAGEGQRRQRAGAARRRQPQACRQSAIRRLAADQPARTISPWSRPGPTAAPSTSTRCRRKPASSA